MMVQHHCHRAYRVLPVETYDESVSQLERNNLCSFQGDWLLAGCGKGIILMVRWLVVRAGGGIQVLVVGGLLLAGTAGCGSPASDKSASDKPAKAESRAANEKPEDRTGAVQPGVGKSGQNEAFVAAANGPADVTMTQTPAPKDRDDVVNIPEEVAKGLGSENPRDRLRALDHWDKDKKASMDPVFDLAEDDDPAVRAKAEAIIEKYLESGEERE